MSLGSGLHGASPAKAGTPNAARTPANWLQSISTKSGALRLLASRVAPAAAEKEKRLGSGMGAEPLVVGLQRRQKSIRSVECAVRCPNRNTASDLIER